jgi:hypothetical protein
MLSFSADQYSTFEENSASRFYTELAVHLWEAFPGTLQARVANLEAMNSVVQKIAAIANRHGFKTDEDIRRFAEFVCEYGADFAERPWVSEILSNRALTMSQKLDRISDYTVFALR